MSENKNKNKNIVEEHLTFLINYKEMLEQSITSMSYKIETYTDELEKITEFLKKHCKHNIEIDYIDTIKKGETLSQMIKYCNKCHLTF